MNYLQKEEKQCAFRPIGSQACIFISPNLIDNSSILTIFHTQTVTMYVGKMTLNSCFLTIKLSPPTQRGTGILKCGHSRGFLLHELDLNSFEKLRFTLSGPFVHATTQLYYHKDVLKDLCVCFL